MSEQQVDNSIEEQESVELPEWSGEGFGEPPPGEGHEAFTDEALDKDAPAVEEPDEGTAPAQAAQPTEEGSEQAQGIEHDPRFKNLRRLQVQQAEELKAERERRSQLEAAVTQLAPLLDPAGEQGKEFDPFDPESVAAFIQAQVQERTSQVEQQLHSRQQVQAIRAQVSQAVDAFRESHPDVREGTELDVAVAAVVQDLQTPDESSIPNHDLFPVTVDNLEIAYELATDPNLYRAVSDLDLFPDQETLQIARDAMANEALYDELKAQPHLLDSDEGIKVAYRRAGMVQQLAQMPGNIQQAAAAGVRQALPQQMRKQAFVETGGTGAPVNSAPGARPGDEFDEVIQVHRQANESIF